MTTPPNDLKVTKVSWSKEEMELDRPDPKFTRLGSLTEEEIKGYDEMYEQLVRLMAAYDQAIENEVCPHRIQALVEMRAWASEDFK